MIKADTTSLKVDSPWEGRSHVVTVRDDRLLVLRPHRKFWLGIGSLILFGGVFLAAPHLDAILGESNRQQVDSLAELACHAIGILLVAIGTLFALQMSRAEFDRRAGVVRKKCCFIVTTWSRPLDEIRSVQAIPGEPTTRGEGDGARLAPTYQLNLVLADPKRPRVNLTSRYDWAGTLITARQVAEFLGVPLLDAVSPTLAPVYGALPIRMADLVAELASKAGVEPQVAGRALGAFLSDLRKSADPGELDTLRAALPEGQAAIESYVQDPGNAPVGFARRFAAMVTGMGDRDARNRARLANRLARAGLSNPQIEAFLGATTDRLRHVLPLEFVPSPGADPSTR